MRSGSPPELDDFPAIAFGWSARGSLFELLHRFAFRCHHQAHVPAGLRLAIECLCNRSRAADLADEQDFYLEVAALVGHSQHVSNPDLARSFGELPVGLNPA